MSSISPRVNGQLLANHIGQPVRVVGTVQGYDDAKQQMQLIASDGTPVLVLLAAQNVGVTWEHGQVLEVIGQAQGNANPTLTEYTSIPFSKGFDLVAYEKLVQMIHSDPKIAQIFHAPPSA